jgi:hypothetical protein
MKMHHRWRLFNVDDSPVWLGWLADRIGSHNATAVTGLLVMAATCRWWKDI